MIDLSLLRCLRTREDYKHYRGHVPLDALEARTQALIKDLDKYYELFAEHEQVDFILFRDLFFSQWHRGLAEEQIQFYDKVLRRMDEPVDDAVKRVLINSLIELKFATDAGNMLAQYQAGDEVPIIQVLGEKAEEAKEKLTRREERVYETPDFDELMADDLNDGGLHWRNPAIANSVRPVRAGDSVIIAGRPDKGKTSFIADNATHWASQCPEDRPILWLSNEGTRNSIIRRSIQAAIGCTTSEMVAYHRTGELMDKYHAAIGHPLALQIEDICGKTNFEVAELIEEVNPTLVIIDMIDKIQFLGIKADGRTDQALEEMYGWFREHAIGNDYALVATSQISAASCDNNDVQMWPHDWMLKDSRTGKQGACDAIMMIGHHQDAQYEHYRYLSAPKNKLKIEGKPALRACVMFDKDRSRFKELQQ